MNLDPALASTTTDLVSLAGEIRAISSQAELDGAKALLDDLGAMKQQIAGFFAPHKANAHKAHKMLCDDENRFLKPLDLAERQIRSASSVYLLAEQRKADAERQRLEAEARAKEEARRKAEAEALEAEAKRLAKRGKTEEVQVLREEAKAKLAEPVFVHVEAPPTPALPKGMSQTVRWGYRVVDFSKVPDEYKIENDAMLKRVAAAMKDRLSIPGIEAVKIDGIALR